LDGITLEILNNILNIVNNAKKVNGEDKAKNAGYITEALNKYYEYDWCVFIYTVG